MQLVLSEEHEYALYEDRDKVRNIFNSTLSAY